MKHESTSHLQSWIHEHGLDAFLVAQPQNRSYLSGWFNEDIEGAGFLLIGENQLIVLTNTLYKEIAEKEATGWTVIVPTARDYASVIADLAREYVDGLFRIANAKLLISVGQIHISSKGWYRTYDETSKSNQRQA